LKPLITDVAKASLTHKTFSSEQVRTLEPALAKAVGCSMFALMARAGKSAFEVMQCHWPDATKILVLTGSGNNAGDGFIFAKQASLAGLSVDLCSPVSDKVLGGDAAVAKQQWCDIGGTIGLSGEVDLSQYDVIVDALLGTGLSGTTRYPFTECIQAINDSELPVISLDIPSGLDANTGKVLGCAVSADVTVTFVGIKPGLVTGLGKQHCGVLEYNDLGIGESFQQLADTFAFRIKHADFMSLPRRIGNAHKGNFGRLLCIGGNRSMAGAIRLSAEAALRCGAGLVKVFCHHDSVLQVSQGRSELMITSDNLSQQLNWADCIVLGPGMGQDAWSRGVFNEVLAYLVHADIPIVIDADGLNLLSHHLYKLKLSQLVITPHPAEAARLLETSTAEVEQDRFKYSHNLATKFTGTAVLKGAGSIVQTTDSCYVCGDGNPGMATAGMGDVLTGVIGAMMAQGMESHDAALYSVCLHAAAGDLAAENLGQRGMLASDLFVFLRQLINQ
jgi:hydroxyethylthiazole kinase-like uncharacterized protein yjeF